MTCLHRRSSVAAVTVALTLIVAFVAPRHADAGEKPRTATRTSAEVVSGLPVVYDFGAVNVVDDGPRTDHFVARCNALTVGPFNGVGVDCWLHEVVANRRFEFPFYRVARLGAYTAVGEGRVRADIAYAMCMRVFVYTYPQPPVEGPVRCTPFQ